MSRAVAERRSAPLNVILCENYFQPGQWLKKLVGELLSPGQKGWFEENAGLVESMVLRSSVEPAEEMKSKDPLSVRDQDMWELPTDRAAFRGDIPAIVGLISYRGYLKGYRLLSEAANDPELAVWL
ncbi:MAG: hypothetical protein ACR2NN_26605 [Bryobacteraceae bacterium]